MVSGWWLVGERVAPGKALGKCGNSGRSPVPHLHLQMQASDRLGSPTIPFILCQYVEGQGAERRYRTAGLPAAGSRVRPVLFDETMTSCFDMVIGRRLRYRLRDGGEREETLTVTVDDTGAYVFTAPAAGAVLTARILHKVWYVLDYRERRRSLLRDFWLGLSRCPLTTEDGLRWTERLDPAPLLPPPLRVLLDLAAPFTAFPEIVVEHVLTTCRGRVGGGEALARIATTVTAPRGLAWALRGTPRRVELTLGPHHGILGGSVVRGDGTRVEIERLEELELQPAGRAG